MALTPGARLGVYEVTTQIGAGGMGEVYQAIDSNLKRSVAIKVLPASVAGDVDRLARFQREAEVLAALNHPNIGAIYGLEKTADFTALVMELVEGEDLSQRIARGAIPLDEALPIARQIADAIEAAHEQGIVHRDLKPANIKVRPDGTVKVLDFGLAKAMDPSGSAGMNVMNSPTLTVHGTMQGVILGTAAYMAPEQARGKTVGKQADVWAFGVVLFEMLTGTRAFEGDDISITLASVLKDEVRWDALPPGTPASVRSLLRRCLQKDLSRRLHHIGDARLELEEPPPDAQTPAVVNTMGSRARERRGWIAAAACAVATAIGLTIVAFTARRPVTSLPEMRVDISTAPSTDPLSLAISPDGQKIVYSATMDGVSRLWVRALAGTSAQPLPGTDLGASPFWSPDGRSLGFFADGKLKRIDIAGGLTQTLANAPIGAGGTWNDQGTIVFAPTIVGGLMRVSASGGDTTPVTKLVPVKQGGHAYPYFLADGRHFIFHSTGAPDARGLFVGALDGSEPRRLMDAEGAGVVTSSGYVLFVRQGTLFAQAFDTERLVLAGDPVAVADRIAIDGNANYAAVSVSRSGPFLYRTGGTSGLRQLVWYDRAGGRTGAIGGTDAATLLNPDLSPDGRYVAFNRTVDNQEIWLSEIARGILRRFTFDPGSDQLPVWSPDGNTIVFSSNRKTNIFNLYRKPVNSPGNEELLLESSENKFAMGFSADGRYLLYRNTGPNTDWDLWALPLEGDRKPFPVVKTSFQEMMGEFSPDGRWVAYQSNESGQYEVYVQPFPEPGARVQISRNGGSQPRWRRDGKELFYVSLDGRMMAAPVSLGANRQLEALSAAVPLFVTRVAGGPVPSPQKQQYVVSPDGRHFLINTLVGEADTSPITLVLNWRPSGAR